jgi:hypothetical protein
MKTDKTQLIQAIEAIKEKLAAMEEELNKTEVFKHFPSKGDTYHYYLSTGTLCDNTASNDNLKINTYKTREEAQKACQKAVALEKIKRRIIELQGDWKPDFNDSSSKYNTIYYNYIVNSFINEEWQRFKYCMLIPYMENKETALTIINLSSSLNSLIIVKAVSLFSI